MKSTSIAAYLIKGIALLILDVIVILLFFSIWTIVNIPLFPWAFCAVMFSLALVNVAVLASKFGIDLMGIGAYTSALISTILYFLFVMVFTGLTYIAILPRWYVILVLIGLLIYVAILAGLFTAGIKKGGDMNQHNAEKVAVQDMNMRIMTLGDNIKSCRNLLESTAYDALNSAFERMAERLNASTPFNRVDKSEVLYREQQIISQLDIIKGEITLLANGTDNLAAARRITDLLTDAETQIRNREKLIVQ